ncbi:MAG TPA: aminotransferase class III-fold pyridoxal phosphate-dependent enzyme [Thermoleophilaceae bacterium]
MNESTTTPATSSDERRRLLGRLLREKAAREVRNHPYAKHVNPKLASILHGLGSDKRFVRGEGCWLFDSAGDRYLDFTAAYGALPFGHSPAEIWAAIGAVGESGEPTIVQPSILDAAGELAARLVEVAPPGLDRVTFANSGAEAVEVALKIARSATGRRRVLSTHDAFHGKTLGALSVSGRSQYQVEFGAPVDGFERIPFGDAEALEAMLVEHPGEIAAFVVEPIQGEGGVNVAPPGYLKAVRELCSQHGVLLVLDEVQTGLGRTGRLFACEHDEIVPDVMTLAKALGGGVVPIGAVLCRSSCATEGFALRHTSTFAGNALACRVGLRALELLTRDDNALVRHVSDVGVHLEHLLREVAGRHPAAVTDVRGRGFLLGVELTDDLRAFGRQGLVGSMAAQEALAPALCSYLLGAEGVRLAPTLFGARVVRVEPPLIATRGECERFAEALDRALAWVSAGDAVGLLGPLIGRQPGTPPKPAPAPPRDAAPRPRPGEPRFGFIVHPLEVSSFHDFDAGLVDLDEDELARLLQRFDESSSVLTPAAMVVGGGRVESEVGSTAYGEIIGIPYTAQQLLDLPVETALRVVGGAVDVARERGAEIVGLGAYTSIVTGNARLIDPGVPVTTGNGFTVAAAVEGVRQAAEKRGVELSEATVAVVGAAGAIGRASSRLLARDCGRLVLSGNPAGGDASMRRLRAVAAEIVKAVARGGEASGRLAVAIREAGGDDVLDRMIEADLLRLSLDQAESLAAADVVVFATSTPEPIATADALARDAIVCDVAQPANVAAAVIDARPDVLLFQGGIVEMPLGRGLGVDYGLADGLAYACMAETMVIALESDHRLTSVGEDLDEQSIRTLQRVARRHGFQLAPVERWSGAGHGSVPVVGGQVR